MTMVQEKFPGFTAEEKRLHTVQDVQKQEAPVVQEAAPTSEDDTDPVQKVADIMAPVVLNLYFKEALDTGEIVNKTGITYDVIHAVLKSYSERRYSKIKFSPKFHDKTYDFWLAHRDTMKLVEIKRELFFKDTSLDNIVSGVRYAGTKYTKAQVMANWHSWHEEHRASKKDQILEHPLYLELKKQRDELLEWKESTIKDLRALIVKYAACGEYTHE